MARASPGAWDSRNAAAFNEAYGSARDYLKKLLDGSISTFGAGRTWERTRQEERL